MVGTDARDLRRLINERLALLVDPRFDHNPDLADDVWKALKTRMVELQKEKNFFIDKYGYDWVFGASAYNSPFEAHLQWRLLNTLSDISPDHPALDRCRNLVVRVIPTSCARPHLRQVEEFHVIILTQGYLSAFKGFIRLWLRGCSLGRTDADSPPTTYRHHAANYLSAISVSENAMGLSAKAYVGTLVQLIANKVPIMDRESIFDGEVLKREQWEMQFGILSGAIDGFLLFHEAAHVLAGDSPASERTLESEIEADRGSASLCIIDEARDGGLGTSYLGAPMFFSVELLRLLCEELMEFREGRHDLASGRYPGISELMIRSAVYGKHVDQYLGPHVIAHYRDWGHAMTLVFNTVRWALLQMHGNQISLAQFISQTENR